jgi:TonB family protein
LLRILRTVSFRRTGAIESGEDQIMTSTLAALLFTTVTALPPLAQTPSGLATPTEGRVVVECLVAPEGALTDCLVVEETPVGHGLGERALAASAKLKMDAKSVGDTPVSGARVRIPFSFKL